MNKFIRGFVLLCIACAILFSTGCVTPPKQPPKKEVPIADLKSLAGKWGGLLRFVPRQIKDDFVTVLINENGAYKFTSYRTVGVLAGSGMLQLEGGKATSTTEKGSKIIFTLYDRGGESVLEARGVDSTGTKKAQAELTRNK